MVTGAKVIYRMKEGGYMSKGDLQDDRRVVTGAKVIYRMTGGWLQEQR